MGFAGVNDAEAQSPRFLRIRFARDESARYLSHLDTVRLFSRTFRRAGLPVAWSQGFNPHPVMTFALPLAVGVSSVCEYADIGMTETVDPAEAIIWINRFLPEGYRVVAAAESDGKGLMAAVYAADYRIRWQVGNPDPAAGWPEIWSRSMDDFMAEQVITAERCMEKQGRKVTRQINIRPLVRSLRPGKGTEADILEAEAVTDAGSRSNLRPDLLAGALASRFAGSCGARIHLADIRRQRLFLDGLLPEGSEQGGLGKP